MISPSIRAAACCEAGPDPHSPGIKAENFQTPVGPPEAAAAAAAPFALALIEP